MKQIIQCCRRLRRQFIAQTLLDEKQQPTYRRIGRSFETLEPRVVLAGSPFLGYAQSIADGVRIEAETFDLGGEGVAYHDNDVSNNGGAFRASERVDIQNTNDVGGGHNVGWTADGEWMEFTVNVAPGTYDISARVASMPADPGDLRLLIGDGTTFTELGVFPIESTGNWQTWQTFTLSSIEMSWGADQVLRAEVIGGDFNFNWLEFDSAVVSGLPTTAVQSGAWDSPATWSNGVPDGGRRAIIPTGQVVTLTGVDHVAKEIVVQGVLEVAESLGTHKSLTADWIHVNSGGVFQIGTATNRYDANDFVINLTGDDPNSSFDIEGVANPVVDNIAFLIAAGGGRLQFFGEEKLTFTKLAATAAVNANQIRVENAIDRDFDGDIDADDGALDWEVGDQIVIASSSTDYGDEEVRLINAIADQGDGTSLITIDAALNQRHYGEIEDYNSDTRTWDLDLRAEVAILNRNVKIRGLAAEDTDNVFGDRARFNAGVGDGFGGHAMIMASAGQITVDSVQFDRMGQTARLGRYPIHWHLAGDRSGDVLRGASITNSNNRGLTIHATHNVLIEGVVLHDVQGHGFFMEDGVETGNQYRSNIAFGIHKVGRSEAVGNFAPDVNDPFIVDTHDHVGQNLNRFLSSAAYWITNPDNTWVGNVSAGSEGTGFWFIFPRMPIGVSASDPQYAGVNANETNLRQFDYNASHSSPAGLNFDRGPDIEVPVGATLLEFFDGFPYRPPAEPQVNFFTAYKHRVGIYHRGNIGNFHENRLADNFSGTFITFTQRITDTLYVGHSRGNSSPSDKVSGHSLYDGANTLTGNHFAGFAGSNAHTFRGHSSARRHTHHVMTNTSFEDDGSADHVSISNQSNGSVHSSGFGHHASGVYDADGTLTGHVGGGPGSVVTANHPFFYDASDIKPAGWNAWVSDDLYTMLSVEQPNSNADFQLTSPDGDVGTEDGNFNTVLKSEAGDYTIEFPQGVASVANGFRFLHYTRVGPSGSTVIRFPDLGGVLWPKGIKRASGLASLRSATRSSYDIVNGDVWVKLFSSSTKVEMVTGLPANQSPVAVDDTITAYENSSTQLFVSANDYDVEDATIPISSFNQPTHGTVTNNGDGTLAYTPDAGYFGSDSFRYWIRDSGFLQNRATVTLNVLAVDLPADFGDAPANYGTTLAADGARHVGQGPRLGTSRDVETDGLPSASADSASSGGMTDDNGVHFGGITAGSMAGINIDLQNAVAAKVDAWIDFNQDGVWETNEKILDDIVVTDGLQTMNYRVPSGARSGVSFARVRVSTAGNLEPNGQAVDGEVEDYAVTIGSVPGGPNATINIATINGGLETRSEITSIEVQFNEEISVLPSDFVLQNNITGEYVSGISVSSVDSGGATLATLTFTGGNSVTPSNAAGVLATLNNGSYELQYRPAMLDGSSSPLVIDSFFRKYGSTDKTGPVGLADFAAFRATFGKDVSEGGFDSSLDSNRDGTVSLTDFAAFRAAFGN